MKNGKRINIPEDEVLLFSEEEIKNRVKKLAEKIVDRFKDKELVLVVILKGGVTFATDLHREIERIRILNNDEDVFIEYLRASSYGNERVTSGVVKIDFDIPYSLKNRIVLVIEDLVDTKLTLAAILSHLETKKPEEICVCALIEKEPDPENLQKAYKKLDPETLKRVQNIKVEFVGFRGVKGFVKGYGLDDEGRRRGQPYITVKKDSI